MTATVAPPIAPEAAHWVAELRADFARINAACEAEMASDRPGAMDRLTALLQVASARRAQIEALEVGQ